MNGVNMSDSPPQSGGFCRNIEAPHRPICSCFWILSCAIAATALFNCLILALSSYTTLPSIVWPLTAGINLILALMLVLKLYIETKRQLESTALSRKQTIDAENNQDRFLETITHELRTPLSSIIGSSEILNTTNTNQLDYDTHINTITNNCQHLLGLVDGLLDVTKIKSGKLEPSLSCTSITDVINEAINISRPIANIKKIQLNTAIKTDTTNWIITDPLRLRQILVNLLGNAIRHTDKGSVTIVFNEEITHTTGMISISIADTGCGIAPDEISRIFEPHFQSGSAKISAQPGLASRSAANSQPSSAARSAPRAHWVKEAPSHSESQSTAPSSLIQTVSIKKNRQTQINHSPAQPSSSPRTPEMATMSRLHK